MGLERLLQNKITRNFGLAAGLAAGLLGLGPRQASAVEIAPLSAARVAGAHGSDWHDRQLLRNPTDETLTGVIVLTPRGQAYDPATDPSLPYSLPAATTLILDDLHEQLKPGEAGAGTLRVLPDGEQAAPLWRATVFNRVDEQEFGAQAFTFDPEIDGYHSAGSTLGTVLSGEGYRDNPFVQSGPDGVSATWVYSNSAGGNGAQAPCTLDPNTTFQYTSGLPGLFGFDPEPGGQLDFIVNEGSARVYLTRNNNASNDPAYDELEVTAFNQAGPRIVGIDYDNDGIADNIDADGNGVLDNVIEASCSAPWPYEMWLIAENAGENPAFNGDNLPQGMGVSSSGLIGYDPPCSDAGQVFFPGFYVSGMTTSMNIIFNVVD